METLCVQYIMTMKLKKLVIVCAVCAVIFTCLLFIYQNEVTLWESYKITELPRIIWWTPFTIRENLELLKCGDVKCAITDNRHFAKNATAFLFYGSSIENWNLPLPRLRKHIWALFHEESPKNLPLLLDKRALQLFNITATFSRFSDVPLTLEHLPNIDNLTTLKYYISTADKNNFRKNGLAPVLYIQSDCETPINRDSYVQELMKYIQVDSYGKCLKNKDFPSELQKEDHLSDLYDPDLMKLVAKYKFTLAFENAICDDYVTEKIWRPLMAGSVPVYLGTKKLRDWLPDGSKSAIFADIFNTPKELAQHLKILDNDNRKYERHLQHKLSDTYPITNNLLKRVANQGWMEDTGSLVGKLECKVCEAIVGVSKMGVESTTPNRVNVYECPRPISPVTMTTNDSNWWTQVWDEAPCHFKVVQRVLDGKFNFTEKEYKDKVFSLYKDGNC